MRICQNEKEIWAFKMNGPQEINHKKTKNKMDGPSDKNLRLVTVESQGTVGLN